VRTVVYVSAGALVEVVTQNDALKAIHNSNVIDTETAVSDVDGEGDTGDYEADATNTHDFLIVHTVSKLSVIDNIHAFREMLLDVISVGDAKEGKGTAAV